MLLHNHARHTGYSVFVSLDGVLWRVKIGGRAHTLAEAEEIGRAGFPFAEISLLDPREFRSGGFAGLQRIARDYAITYLVHGPEEGDAWDPGELQRAYLPQIRSLIDCAAELQAPVFTLHFWLDPRFIPGPVRDEKIKLLQDLAGYADDRGVQLCIENLSEQARDFAPAFAASAALGMTLDIGHGQLLADRNTAYEFADQHLERIRHVHAHDNCGGNSPRDDLHLPIGAGLIDFAALLGCLKARGYDGTITLEVKQGDLVESSKIFERLWRQATISASST
jgi:sugar phosphate isomerase/epimerase